MIVLHQVGWVLALSTVHIGLAYLPIFTIPILLTTVAPSYLRGRVLAVSSLLHVCAGVAWQIAIGTLSDRMSAHSNGLLMALLAVAVPSTLLAPILLLRISEPFRVAVAAASAP